MASLAASHCWAIQSAPRRVGSSALTEAHGQHQRIGHLLHQRGFAHLAGPRHHLDEAARLGEPGGQHGGLGRWKGLSFCLTC
jgi:hypothetical protein